MTTTLSMHHVNLISLPVEWAITSPWLHNWF